MKLLMALLMTFQWSPFAYGEQGALVSPPPAVNIGLAPNYERQPEYATFEDFQLQLSRYLQTVDNSTLVDEPQFIEGLLVDYLFDLGREEYLQALDTINQQWLAGSANAESIAFRSQRRWEAIYAEELNTMFSNLNGTRASRELEMEAQAKWTGYIGSVIAISAMGAFSRGRSVQPGTGRLALSSAAETFAPLLAHMGASSIIEAFPETFERVTHPPPFETFDISRVESADEMRMQQQLDLALSVALTHAATMGVSRSLQIASRLSSGLARGIGASPLAKTNVAGWVVTGLSFAVAGVVNRISRAIGQNRLRNEFRQALENFNSEVANGAPSRRAITELKNSAMNVSTSYSLPLLNRYQSLSEQSIERRFRIEDTMERARIQMESRIQLIRAKLNSDQETQAQLIAENPALLMYENDLNHLGFRDYRFRPEFDDYAPEDFTVPGDMYTLYLEETLVSLEQQKLEMLAEINDELLALEDDHPEMLNDMKYTVWSSFISSGDNSCFYEEVILNWLKRQPEGAEQQDDVYRMMVFGSRYNQTGEDASRFEAWLNSVASVDQHRFGFLDNPSSFLERFQQELLSHGHSLQSLISEQEAKMAQRRSSRIQSGSVCSYPTSHFQSVIEALEASNDRYARVAAQELSFVQHEMDALIQAIINQERL